APLVNCDDGPHGRPDRQDEPARGNQRDDQGTEHDDHDQQRQPDDDAQVQGQDVGECIGNVNDTGGLARQCEVGDLTGRLKIAQLIDQVDGGFVVGVFNRNDLEHQQITGVVFTDRYDVGDLV